MNWDRFRDHMCCQYFDGCEITFWSVVSSNNRFNYNSSFFTELWSHKVRISINLALGSGYKLTVFPGQNCAFRRMSLFL